MMRDRVALIAGIVLAGVWLGLADESGDSCLADFQRREGETDDSARFQRAVDATPSGVLSVPRGLYLISKTILVTNRCSLALNKTAVLRAVKPMDYIVHIDNSRAAKLPGDDIGVADCNLFVTGGKIDGNGLASCLYLANPVHFTLRDTTFLNGCRTGLRVHGGYEVIADNLYFKCVKSGLAGNVAVYLTGGDSHCTDCVVVDYTVGFRNAGGSNRFTRCHVWGGPLPPVKSGEEREMLKDSICFWNEGGDAVFRDCYADTGKTGFLVAASTHLFGCRSFNNRTFGLDDLTVIRQVGGTLLASGCHFMDGGTPKIRIYSAEKGLAGKAVFRDCQASPAFADADRIEGVLDFEIDQTVKCADDWELVTEKPYAFSSPAGEFRKTDARGTRFEVSRHRLKKRFPSAGPGKCLVVRARATTPQTRLLEIALVQVDSKVWGTNLELSQEWRDIVVPFEKLRYFKQWGFVKPFTPGDAPDARLLGSVNLCIGKWLCTDSLDSAHGFEIESIRVTGR